MLRRSIFKNSTLKISTTFASFRFCGTATSSSSSSTSNEESSPNVWENMTQVHTSNHQNQHHQGNPISSTHVDASSGGVLPGMVDVSGKKTSNREATAIGHIYFPPSVAKAMMSNNNNNNNNRHHSSNNNILEFCTKKGPIFTTATIAATQAAKQTSNMIPFCHPIPIRKCKVEWDVLSSVQVKSVCPFHTGAEVTVPFEYIEENQGLMDILEKNPKFKPRICHDSLRGFNNSSSASEMQSNNTMPKQYVSSPSFGSHQNSNTTSNNTTNDNNNVPKINTSNDGCPRGSSCPFVHISTSEMNPFTNQHFDSPREAQHALEEYQSQSMTPQQKREAKQVKLYNNLSSFYGHHVRAYQHYHKTRRQRDVHVDIQNWTFRSNSGKGENDGNPQNLPPFVNVQGSLVPIHDLELNRAIDQVMERPLSAVRWCKDGDRCEKLGTGMCSFAHLRQKNNVSGNNNNIRPSHFNAPLSALAPNRRNSASMLSPTSTPEYRNLNKQLREPLILDSLAAKKGFRVFAKVSVGVGDWYTGVEMEALTATTMALLTLYDMCKGIPGALDEGMRLGRVQLVEKIGGKSGHWVHDSVVLNNSSKKNVTRHYHNRSEKTSSSSSSSTEQQE